MPTQAHAKPTPVTNEISGNGALPARQGETSRPFASFGSGSRVYGLYLRPAGVDL